jgi:multiple sugar transport system permease protein
MTARDSQTAARVHLTGARMLRTMLLYGSVIALSLIFAAPLLWMVSTSLKTDPQVYHVPPIWIPNPARWANYTEALTKRPFGLYTLNTLRYAFGVIIGALLSNTIVAYGFSRLRWPGRNLLFFICISAMMIPYQVRMVPLFLVFKKLDWINSYKPLIVPAFLGAPYYIFLLRQFFLTIPEELSDAARVDGSSEMGILLRIILPLAKPALATIALFQLLGAWEDYLGPLIYLNDEALYPIAIGLQQFRSQFQEALMWPYMMAASTAATLPVILIFFAVQRSFVEGITVTGLKG